MNQRRVCYEILKILYEIQDFAMGMPRKRALSVSWQLFAKRACKNRVRWNPVVSA